MSTVSPAGFPYPGDWIDLAEQEAGTAHAPGAGPTVTIKANIAVRGLPRTAGCTGLSGDVAAADAPVVAALRRGGARILGTSNMHELAFGITSDNVSYGPVTVPGHPDRSAGGSSGGAAAIVARGHADLGVGTDTGGSVSIPAALNGVYGFRPSTGRYPAGGLVGLSFTRDTPGLFARSLAGVVEADAIITSRGALGEGPAGLRVGVPREYLLDLDPEVEALFNAALERLEDVEVVSVDWGPVLENTRAAEMPVVLWEAKRLLSEVAAAAFGAPPEAAYRRLVDGVASADVRGILESTLSHPVGDDAYAEALRSTFAAREGYEALLTGAGLDALVFPTTPAVAPLVEQGQSVSHRGERVDAFGLYTRHTGAGTMLGAPMLTLPGGRTPAGLPSGFTVQGRRGRDEELLRLGAVVDAHING
ncbi:amidase [Galactobacter valiniphilus]|uniref:Amidase n=1 Tax=Galactobacter valiniphilus TaxID=2676122 RepID=A0A399J974_9MICC|nr:amidase family protein [Galactobacter valiniphilus]RII42105.1 amidase [Galactobacter valiniphilus]